MNPGAKVIVHNQTGTIIGEYMPDMFEVRMWDGLRHVGDIVVPSREIHTTCMWCHDSKVIDGRDVCQACSRLL